MVPNLTKFNIVIPTYNCQDWIIDCVKSVYAQQHTNYNCVIVNDASDDDTKNILSSIQFLKDDERFHVINRENNGGPLSSHIHGWRHLDTDSDENSVLVIVDGDDRLFSPLSLTIVDQAYQQTNCLMTYGNHIHYPTGKSSNCETIPRDVCQNNDFRNYKFVTSHLRTFKSILWKNVKNEDLRDENGDYYRAAGDLAAMIPLLEMSSERTVFIGHVLYLYNCVNPISEEYTKMELMQRTERRVRSGKKYQRLNC